MCVKTFEDLRGLNLEYENIHSHSYYSNIMTHDSVISRNDIAHRAKELGHQTLSCLEHGYCGNLFEAYKVAQKNGLNLIFGTEFYYVKDRFEKDRTNSHVLVVAKTEVGREAITGLISEANTTGFYGRPRIDESLLFSLPPNDVIVTTACIASPVNLYGDDYAHYFVKRGKEYFGDNFFLEVQPHTNKKQQDFHEKLIKLKNEYNVEMILGVDTHYIYEKDAHLRDIYLVSRNIDYPEEEGFIMDYPDVDTLINRFSNQSILEPRHVIEAMNSTLIVRDFEHVHLDKEIKMPSLYPELNHEEKVLKLKEIINKAWVEDRKHIPKEKWKEYIEAIQFEIKIIEDTAMEDYFLLNEKVIDRAVNKHGGVLTRTGRGCFEETALVQTINGLKKISDVEIGDRVINRFGEFDNVIDTLEYQIEEDMIEIEHLYKSGKNFPVKATLDHKILIMRDGNVNFIEAQHIRDTDYVCMPKIKIDNGNIENIIIDLNEYNTFGYRYDSEYIYEEYNKVNSKNNKKIKRYVEIDDIFNTFIGLMYSDGNTQNNRIHLYVNTKTHKVEDNKIIFNNIADRLGLNMTVSKQKNKNMETLSINSNILCSFIEKFLFKSSISKHKEFNVSLYNQNKKNLVALKNGLLLSDGSISGNREAFDNTSMSLVSAYKMLNDLINESPLGLTYRASGIDSRGYNRQESFKLRKPLVNNSNKRTAQYLEDDNYFYLPITKLTKHNNVKTTVYDLTIEDDPSFVIYNMVVHNSAPSFYVNKLLGFTEIDRLDAPVTLFATRFMSVARILETVSLPD